MTRLMVAALVLGLLSVPVLAQDPDKVVAFNEAWGVYAEAAQSGDVNVAIEAANDVLNKGRAIFPDTDERIAVLTQNYAAALKAGYRMEEAQEQYGKAVDLLEDIHGRNSVKLVPVLAEYADASARPRRPEDQIRIYKRALGIMDKHYGDDSKEYAELSFRMGRNVYEMSASFWGEKYVDRACDLFQKHYGPADRRFGACNLTLGQTKMSDGHFAKSLLHFDKALAAFEGDTEVDRSYRVRIRSLSVQSLLETNRKDEATKHLHAIGRDLEHAPPVEYAPVYRVPPEYPEVMLAKGVQGYVVVELTVDEDGFVRDAVVADSGPLGDGPQEAASYKAFHGPALRSVGQYRYAPKFQDGKPTTTSNVRTKITFQFQRR